MKNKIISVVLAAVLSAFTVLATVMSASAAEGAVSQHYDGEIKGQGQTVEYKFSVGISGDFEFSVTGQLQKYGVQFFDDAGHKYVEESCHSGSFNEKLYISAGTYTIKISAYEKVTGKYSVDFTFTPFYESFSETEEGSNNTLESANNAETETIYSGLLTETDTPGRPSRRSTPQERACSTSNSTTRPASSSARTASPSWTAWSPRRPRSSSPTGAAARCAAG